MTMRVSFERDPAEIVLGRRHKSLGDPYAFDARQNLTYAGSTLPSPLSKQGVSLHVLPRPRHRNTYPARER